MNKYKVKYTLNEKLHWTNILAENEHTAAKNVYKQISEAYPDDDYEYVDIESDFDDGEVMEGTSFITDGYEYKWIGRMGDSVHLDFDNWAVWAAENQDTNEIQFFIVEEDTGFIDWGPVDTAKEAIEFLQSKIDDYNQDESLVENSKKIIYNIKEDVSKEFIDLPSFTKRWKELGLNDEDYRELQNLIIKGIHADPLGTDCHKIRFSPSRLNKGKNTSSRIIYIDFIEKGNVYFITVFSKSDEANITRTELADIRELSKLLQGV